MATIRAYTTIEQSNKLAEILPIESADMYYEPSTGFCTEPSEVRFGDIKYAHPRSIRCWSLAALLGVLPFVNFTTPQLIGTPKILYRCIYNDNLMSHAYDSPVDACYEMIIKLHELNLL